MGWPDVGHLRILRATDMDEARTLFLEYAEELGVDLCFQGFEEELASLPGKYAPPTGELLFAYHDDQLAGCGAFRKLEIAGTCELKRVYVRTEFRGHKIGFQISKQLCELAVEAGYRRIVLDTLERLVPARKMYEKLGFKECAPYYPNPVPSVVYLEKLN